MLTKQTNVMEIQVAVAPVCPIPARDFNVRILKYMYVLFSLGVLWSRSSTQRRSRAEKGFICVPERSEKCSSEETREACRTSYNN